MGGLKRSTTLYIAGLALAALGGTLGALIRGGLPNRDDALLALAFAGLVTAAWLFPLHLSFKTKLYLDAGVILAAVLCLEPGLAMLVTGAGAGLAQAIRPASRDLPQALFNAAQTTVQTAAGALIVAAAGWTQGIPFDHPSQLLPVAAAAAAVMFLISTAAVALVVAFETGMSPLAVWHQSTVGSGRAAFLAQVAQYGIGLLAAVVASGQPWALALLMLPGLAVHSALAHHMRHRRQAEDALRGSEASLAEAQRIARLGSWTWDLTTGEQVWSDEVFRILGFAPHSFVPTHDVFLACVHAADREAVRRSLGEAAAGRRPHGLDHRVVLADGAERTVHAQGELIRDAAGLPVRLMGTIHDITERKTLEDRLAHQAFHDALTGLPNRALFTDRLDHALARAGQSAPPVGVLFLDLDRFKVVNDSLGHEVGDELLVAVARRLRACVRPTDTVARLGGDEFTVLLEDLGDAREPVRVAERIAAALQSPFALGSVAATGGTAQREVFVTTSIGIVVSAPGQDQPADLLRVADVAMYRAKHGGRARYAVFDPSMNADVWDRLAVESDLRRALERDEFRVRYQPQVALDDGELVAFEALVRWHHPERGVILPGAFVPLAEETGLVVPIGRWVLREACRQLRAWHEARPGEAPPRVSVNLSARQVREPDLVEDVARALRDSGLDARYLELEITESVLMDDTPATLTTLRALKGLGVRLAIDDFGSGYSSFAYLQSLPVDHLKIDRSFVREIGQGSAGVIVAAMVGLARAMGLQVTAEGVETVEQEARLRGLGCDLGQGNHFAEPLAADGALALLSRRVAAPRPAAPVVATIGELVAFPVRRTGTMGR